MLCRPNPHHGGHRKAGLHLRTQHKQRLATGLQVKRAEVRTPPTILQKNSRSNKACSLTFLQYTLAFNSSHLSPCPPVLYLLTNVFKAMWPTWGRTAHRHRTRLGREKASRPGYTARSAPRAFSRGEKTTETSQEMGTFNQW